MLPLLLLDQSPCGSRHGGLWALPLPGDPWDTWGTTAGGGVKRTFYIPQALRLPTPTLPRQACWRVLLPARRSHHAAAAAKEAAKAAAATAATPMLAPAPGVPTLMAAPVAADDSDDDEDDTVRERCALCLCA